MSEEHAGGDNEVQSADGRRPGDELRRARERAGIERNAVAQRLRLRLSQLDALEQDDYAQLPPPTFVRGYIRTYAREVGLDADDLIAVYDASAAPAEEPPITPAPGEGAAPSGRGALVGLLMILLIVGGGAGAWFYQHRAVAPAVVQGDDAAQTEATQTTADESEAPADGEETTADAPEATADAATTDAGATSAADDAAAGEDAGGAAASDTGAGDANGASTDTDTAAAADEGEAEEDGTTATGDGESEVASAPGEASPRGAADGDGPADAGDASGGEEAVGAEGTAGGADADSEEALPESTDVAGDATTEAAAQGPDRLVLEFSGRSWVQVFDDRERKLVYTLYYGSDPVEVRGWTPFDVLLGNSPAVTLRLNGEAVDKSRFTRSDDTARFLLDGSGARPR